MPRDRTAAHRLQRWFTLGSGPLRRSSDRVEFAARVAFVLAVLASLVAAVVVAGSTYAQARADGAVQADDRHQGQARLVEDAPDPVHDTWDGPVRVSADAVWTSPAGVDHPVTVRVPPGVLAGHDVTIWVDRAGDPTPAPLTSGDAVGLAVSDALGIAVAGSVSAFLVFCVSRFLLDRQRDRRWASDWAAVEPDWANRTV